MKDYWLAKLISSVDAVDSRKRLQKAVYLLQRAGCPLQCDYLLHYYGPYSFELAGLMDTLNGARIVEEMPERLGPAAVRYRSTVTPNGREAIARFEATRVGRQLRAAIEPFLTQFAQLNHESAWVLELAATAAFYYEGDWNAAERQTAQFKKVSADDSRLRNAVKLARRFKQSA